MAARGAPYRGVLYAGLMLTADGPQVIEFNCRFGDPETQVVLSLLETDLVDLMCAALEPGRLAALGPVRVRDGAAVGVVLASGGYPGPYDTGRPIAGLAAAGREALVVHAGTRGEDAVVTSGGRVLTLVGLGATHAAARGHAYAGASKVEFAGKQFRSDIAAGVVAPSGSGA